MKKLIFLSILVLISCNIYAGQKQQLPNEIKAYLIANFPSESIREINKPKGAKNTEIILEDMERLVFNKKKQIIEISCDKAIPTSTVSTKIVEYINTNYSNTFIKTWKLIDKKNNQQVILNNDTTLEFDKNGVFVRVVPAKPADKI
jgi:hypothetical protein